MATEKAIRGVTGHNFELNKRDIIGNKRDLQRTADHECIKLAVVRHRICRWADRQTCITIIVMQVLILPCRIY